MVTHTFGKIYQSGTAHVKGVLKLWDGGISWTNPVDGKENKIASSDMVTGTWVSINSGSILKIGLKGGASVRYVGLKASDLDNFKKHFSSHFGVNIKTEILSSAGHNWGMVSLNNMDLSLTTVEQDDKEKRTVFEMPMSDITQCAVPVPDEVEIQFSEENASDKVETVVSMRFFIPDTATLGGVEDDEEDDDDEEKTAALALQKVIVDRCGLGANTGDTIVEFDEKVGNFLTPRGRYKIELYAKEMRLHGKTYDYTIQYKSISRLYLLPRREDLWAFVISLSVPIRQGAQRYAHLVMNVANDQYMARVHLQQNEIDELYGKGKLATENKGELHRVIAKVFKLVTGKKIYTVNNFQNAQGGKSIRCTLKGSDGLLFPLGKSFLFIHKPCTYIPFDSIVAVEFLRFEATGGGMKSRTFDLQISCRSVTGSTEHQFVSIGRHEYKNLFRFLKDKNITIRNIKSDEKATGYAEEGSEEDSDFAPDDQGSDDDSDFDGSEDGGSSSDDDDGDDEAGGKRRPKKKARK
eukprot:g4829.t1